MPLVSVIIREDRTGNADALPRVIDEFKGELYIIVDDDNVLRRDYLETAVKISADYPWLGAWGGSCLPEFEVEPPANLRPWIGGLCIEKVEAPVWSKLRCMTSACPPGAGMVVRRQQVLRYKELILLDPVHRLLGPHGKKPGAGDDGDMALCGYGLGLGVGRFPELELTHLIPACKLTLEFLEQLYEGIGYSSRILDDVYNRAHSRFPGRGNPSYLRTFLLRIGMFVTRKSRAERRIRTAIERGSSAARRDLRQFEKLGVESAPNALGRKRKFTNKALF